MIEVTQEDREISVKVRNAWDVNCDTAAEIIAQYRQECTSKLDATYILLQKGYIKIEVTQADLDAAAELIEQYWSGSDANMMKLADSTRKGHRQGAFPRAFARHRQESTIELQEKLNKAIEALFYIKETYPEHGSAIHARVCLEGLVND